MLVLIQISNFSKNKRLQLTFIKSNCSVRFRLEKGEIEYENRNQHKIQKEKKSQQTEKKIVVAATLNVNNYI